MKSFAICSSLLSLVIVSAAAAAAQADDFFISNVGNTTTVYSPQHGTWNPPRGVYGEAALISTGPGTTMPSGANTLNLSFDVTFHNYMSAQSGHLAVFARSDIYTPNSSNPNYPYRGHGLVFGNVLGYPSFYHPSVGTEWLCSQPPNASTISIEVAGSVSGRDNCVFGSDASYYGTLQDEVTYRVYLTSSFSWATLRNNTSYALYGNVGGSLYYIYGRQISYAYDFQTLVKNGVATPIGGHFFGEVGRGYGTWSIDIRGLTSWN